MIFILSTTKKLSEISFCPRFEIYVLIVSTLVFAFEIIRPFTFCAVKKVSFPQSRMFSTLKELSHIQVTISYSNNFSTFKELFYSQKGSLKAPVLDPLNSKCKTIFSLLILVSNRRSYLHKQ